MGGTKSGEKGEEGKGNRRDDYGDKEGVDTERNGYRGGEEGADGGNGNVKERKVEDSGDICE